MFIISKNARISARVASESFSQADISNMKSEIRSGDKWFFWPFDVDVIGCGDVGPVDYDPEVRYRFDDDPDYEVNNLLEDVRTLSDKHGVAFLVKSFNRGLDLELRQKARPKPSAKMSDNDKAAHVMIHNPDVVTGGTCSTLAEYAKWYDENVAA